MEGDRNSAITEWRVTNDDASLSYGPICVVQWLGATTEAALVDFHDMCRRRLQDYPDGIAAVGIAEPCAVVPDARHRELAALINDDLAAMGAHIVAMIPTTGFLGACIRSVVTGLHGFARKSYPLHVVASTAQLCELVRTKKPLPGVLDDTEHVLDAFRAKHLTRCAVPVATPRATGTQRYL